MKGREVKVMTYSTRETRDDSVKSYAYLPPKYFTRQFRIKNIITEHLLNLLLEQTGYVGFKVS